MKKPAILVKIAAVGALAAAAAVPAHAASEDIIVPLAVVGAILYVADQNNHHNSHHGDRHDSRHYDRDRHNDHSRAQANARRHYGYHRREEVRHNRWHAYNDRRWDRGYYWYNPKYRVPPKYAYRTYH